MPINTTTPNHAVIPRFSDRVSMVVAFAQITKLKGKGVDCANRPPTLLTDEIDTLESVFQARSGKLVEHHVGELLSGLKVGGTVEPLVVWRCGAHAFLLDGHHRLEAYRRLEQERQAPAEVPVSWFEGSAQEAAVRAAMMNSRPKLAMAPHERSDHAWRMVVTGQFTVQQVTQAATVSRRNVQNMRRALQSLGEDAQQITTWSKARMAWKDLGRWDDREIEDEADEIAEQYANRMAREFSTKLAQNPTIAAKTLAIYFGRNSEDVISLWCEEVQFLPTMPEDIESDE